MALERVVYEAVDSADCVKNEKIQGNHALYILGRHDWIGWFILTVLLFLPYFAFFLRFEAYTPSSVFQGLQSRIRAVYPLDGRGESFATDTVPVSERVAVRASYYAPPTHPA